MKLVVVFSYVGLAYNGLERANGGRTIEGVLLTAIASVIKEKIPRANISFVNISRASSTDPGEHSTCQVISLELVDDNLCKVVLENLDAVNEYLAKHSSIKVADIRSIDGEFSARRSCDTCTYEIYIPTYVFDAPPTGTHYYSEYVEEPDADKLFPPPPIEGESVYVSLKRSLSKKYSIKRNGTGRLTPLNTFQDPTTDNVMLNAITPPNTACIAEPGTRVLPSPPSSGHKMDEIPTAPIKEVEKGSAVFRFFKGILGRKRTAKASKQDLKGFQNTPEIRVMADVLPYTEARKSEHENHDNLQRNASVMTNLKRSISRNISLKRSNTTVSTRQRYMGVEFEPIQDDSTEPNPNAETKFYSPLYIPSPGEEAKSNIRGYRMEARQFKTFSNIIQLYRGTHNFHNYIPDASPEDSRAFVRISEASCEEPTIHEGMEWIKVSMTSKGFGKTQIRKMIALAVMVTRTNTPRSIVGNSFGAFKIEVPEFPPFGIVLNDLSFKSFTAQFPDQLDMNSYKEKFEAYKTQFIMPSIFKFEKEYLSVEPFIRSLDSFSFLYSHFLNSRGVVCPQTTFLKQASDEITI